MPNGKPALGGGAPLKGCQPLQPGQPYLRAVSSPQVFGVGLQGTSEKPSTENFTRDKKMQVIQREKI